MIENRWTIDANYTRSYIAVNDHKKKVGLFSDGENAEQLLAKCEELGENTAFIDWLYDNGYESVMNEYHYRNR